MKLNGRVGALYTIRYKGGVAGEEPLEDHSDDPLKVSLGLGQLPEGIEEALCYMEPGDEKVVTVTPDKGFGDYVESNVETYPRVMFEFGDKLSVGDVVMWDNRKMGTTVPVRVIDANETAVRLDFNHPLAGKTLEYWLRVDSVAN